MITHFSQEELATFGAPTVAKEEQLGLETAESHQKKTQAHLNKLHGLYNGTAPTLYKPYMFYTSGYDRRTKQFFTLGRSETNNMKAGLEQEYTKVMNQIVKPIREAMYMIIVRQTIPLYCSEAFNSTVCRSLIGKAIMDKELELDNVQHHTNPDAAIDIHMNPKSLDYKYVAFVKNFDQKIVKRVNLTIDFEAAKAEFSKMVGKGKDYHAGVIGHLAKQEFWMATTSRHGAGDEDVYELLGEWFQEKGGLFKEQPAKFNEEGADLLTKETWDAELKSTADKLRELYKGPGEVLYRHYEFNVVVYHRSSHVISSLLRTRYWNMKEAVRAMNQIVYNNIIKAETDEAYLYFVSETTAFHCSEGALDTEICQRMLGWALFHKHLVPEDHLLFNTHIPDSSPEAKYVAYLRDKKTKEVVRQNLTKEYAKSATQFKEYTQSADAKYSAGIIGHTTKAGWWTPYSELVGDHHNFDVFQLLAEYCQKTLKTHINQGNDEKAANLTIRTAIEAKWKGELEALQGLYKGKGETMQHSQYSFTAIYHEHSHAISVGTHHTGKNMKAHITHNARWIYDHIVKTLKPYDYIIGFGKTRAVLHCSDGKPTESITCQRLIGWSIAHNQFQEGGKLAWDATDDKRLYDNRVPKLTEKHEYYALVHDHRKEGSGIKKMVLGNSAQATQALAAYKALFTAAKAEYTVGVFLDSKEGGINNHLVTHFTGN